MKQQIQRLLRTKWALPTATGVVGLGVGALFGYMRTKRQYDRIETSLSEIRSNQLEFDLVSSESVSEIRDLTNKMESIMHQPSSGLEAHPAKEKQSDEPKETKLVILEDVSSLEDIGKAVATNIFTNDGDEWDYKTELEKRDKSDPYVIHVDEFVADEMGWDSQSTLTWYEKDQILTDSHDKPVYNHAELVGELRFGHGSNDANVVYIRNERLQCEYEVLRDEGSYEEIVLGEQMEHQTQAEELRHSRQLRFTSLRSD